MRTRTAAVGVSAHRAALVHFSTIRAARVRASPTASRPQAIVAARPPVLGHAACSNGSAPIAQTHGPDALIRKQLPRTGSCAASATVRRQTRTSWIFIVLQNARKQVCPGRHRPHSYSLVSKRLSHQSILSGVGWSCTQHTASYPGRLVMHMACYQGSLVMRLVCRTCSLPRRHTVTETEHTCFGLYLG